MVLHLLQCRPQSSNDQSAHIEVPVDVPRHDILFTASDLIPNGVAERIRYILYVDPSQYARLAPPSEKLEVARALGRLNRILKDEEFILIGPGRWGSSNDLGVKVTHADVSTSKAGGWPTGRRHAWLPTAPTSSRSGEAHLPSGRLPLSRMASRSTFSAETLNC